MAQNDKEAPRRRKIRFSLRYRLQVRRLKRNQDGATAVEFALISIPFFALIFAIIEIGLVFFAGQVLETAVADSGRLVLTGQAQNGNFNAARFRQEVCRRSYGMFDCGSRMHIDVRTSQSFANANLQRPVDANGNIMNNFTYNPGDAGDIVVVRVFYEWPVIVPGLGNDLRNMSGNRRLLVATSAFRNEPFR
jgi:Flp pilus assembly protein TadG